LLTKTHILALLNSQEDKHLLNLGTRLMLSHT